MSLEKAKIQAIISLSLQPPQLPGESNRLSPVRYIHLAEDVDGMAFHGADCDKQLFRDFVIRAASSNQP